MYPSILVASLLAVTSVSAQTGRTVYVPGNTPTVGSCNVIPFGTTKNNATWSNQKYQTLLLGSQLGKVPGQIIDIAFAPCGTGDGLRAEAVAIWVNVTGDQEALILLDQRQRTLEHSAACLPPA